MPDSSLSRNVKGDHIDLDLRQDQRAVAFQLEDQVQEKYIESSSPAKTCTKTSNE